jgi:hypothetical protein
LNSNFEAKGTVNGATVGMCKPDLGYFLVAEYSPNLKHGSSTNLPVEIDKNLVLPSDNSGPEPVLKVTIAF